MMQLGPKRAWTGRHQMALDQHLLNQPGEKQPSQRTAVDNRGLMMSMEGTGILVQASGPH